MITFTLAIKITNVSDLLSGQEDSNFIEEKVEEVRR
jgi:hypothetical protein